MLHVDIEFIVNPIFKWQEMEVDNSDPLMEVFPHSIVLK